MPTGLLPGSRQLEGGEEESMADMQFGLMLRAQFPPGDDMPGHFRELVEQARLANRLGYASLTTGMHYSSTPWQGFQQFPFLSRIMAEAPDLRVNFGLVLLSLHKPLDIAEQLATIDVMSGGKVIFGAALGYREVEYLAFGTTQKARVKRGDNNLGVDFDELIKDRFLLGSPDEVAEQMLTLHRTTGINHLIMSVQWPGMAQSLVLDELHMLAEEVFPKVRQG
jgi:alkanesulfonate monooxygenase SsuD/methylene tetrahydromethanopterin reductase-like flavin-dependent oxidoreductase (luciferase family)